MFLNNYSEIASTTKLEINEFKKGIYKTCRFCGQSNNKVRFNNRPHIIPELLGKNNYLSNDECDSCNEMFGEAEYHLALFVQPYLTICGIKTKKKIPKFESRKDDRNNLTKIYRTHEGLHADFGRNLTDFSRNIDSVSIELRKKPYIPLLVYKAFVKVGISLMPIGEVENCFDTIEWLKGVDNDVIYSTEVIRTRINKMYSKPFASIYKAKNIHEEGKEYPEYVLLIGTANLLFQIFLPFGRNNILYHKKGSQLIFDIFPASILNGDYTKIDKDKVKFDFNFTRYDLSSSEKIVEDDNLILLTDAIQKH
ncbi:MAG: hypothetical protein N4A49_00985 [Marinifilaceae bacterium]|jgi:hypothetical protein|nr:hypothetical protein [Marinifilaceae bacterium]